MDAITGNELITLIVSGAPNFIGFLVLAWVMWKIIVRQLDILEKLVDDCLQEDRYIDRDKSDLG